MEVRTLWIDPSFPVALSPALLEDLDFPRFVSHFLRMDAERAEAWIAHHLCAEEAEIARRSKRVQALLDRNGALDTLKALHAQTCALEEAWSAMRHSQGLLARCTCALALFRDYLYAVDCACEAFAGVPGFEDVSEWMRAWRASEAHRAVETGVRQAGELFRPLKAVTIRTSLQESGDALDFSIEAVEDEGEVPVSLLDTGGQAINSLLPPMPLRVRNDLVHLEAFVLKQVEARWKPRLTAAERSLRDLPVQAVEAWIEAMRPMEFYLSALDFAQKMDKGGCPLCRPTRDAHAFRFAALHSPHLILQGQASVPYDHALEVPVLLLVTGANHAGKTTFLKTLAQNCLLAQLGFPVPAQAFAFPFAQSMHTVFAAGESAALDRSRFEQEALALRETIRLADANALIWVNEPFTSTNPVEAADMLADALADMRQREATLCCVTHLYETYDRLRAAAIPVKSLVVERGEGPEGLSVRLRDKAPDGVSYARAIAEAFQINMERFVEDPVLLGRMQALLRKGAQS